MFHRFAIPALLGFALCALTGIAHGQAGIAPDGWTASDMGPMTIYQAPGGTEAMMTLKAPPGVMTPEAIAEAVAGAVANIAQGPVETSTMSVEGAVAVQTFKFSSQGKTISGQGFGIPLADGSSLGVIHMGDASDAGLRGRVMQTRAKAMALAGGTPAVAPSRPAPIAGPIAGPKTVMTPPPAPKAGAYAQSDVVIYLFDLSYTYGLGGMTGVDYQPVAIFKDGTAVKLEGYAVEDVDVAALRRSAPDTVGTWRKVGNEYHVRYADGETEEMETTVGPAFPWPSEAGALNGAYKSIGGGGNTALGGSVMTFDVEDFVFFPDGSFSQTNFRGGSTGISTNTVKSGTAGTWRLDGSTLTLAYVDGKTVRTSLFFSGKSGRKGGAEQLRVLWIGGENYRRK